MLYFEIGVVETAYYVYNIHKERVKGGTIMKTLTKETQQSICSVCINRPNCLKDIEFYRLEQKYSLRGMTCACRVFKSREVTKRFIDGKNLCLNCELKTHCGILVEYQRLQFQKRLTRTLIECPYVIS